MTRRFSFLAALALVASIATGAQAQNTIASFGAQNGLGLISYSTAGMASTLVINQTIGFNVVDPSLLINPANVGPFNNANLSLTATTTSAPSGSPGTQNGFTGSFSVVSQGGGMTLLSGTFASGTLEVQNRNAFFNALDVDYTGGIFVPGLFDEALNFAILGLNPNLPGLANNGFQNFTGNSASGNFAGAIPEPATLAMAGFGILALPLAARVARRRRSVISN